MTQKYPQVTEVTGGVCAWCRHEYDAEKNPTRLLSDEEYAKLKCGLASHGSTSHGVCRKCSEQVVEEHLGLQEEK